MPCNRSRIRKSAFLNNAYVPMPPNSIKRKAALNKKGKNEACTRCKSTRLSPSVLICKALFDEPVHASCLESTKDETGVCDGYCNKETPLVFQNLMNHIKTKAHQKKFDSQIEARKCIEDMTKKIKSSQEEKGIRTQAKTSSTSNNIRFDVKMAQLKS